MTQWHLLDIFGTKKIWNSGKIERHSKFKQYMYLFYFNNLEYQKFNKNNNNTSDDLYK